MANYSGTINSGGTSQVAAPADAFRATVYTASLNADLWVSFGSAAVADSPSIYIPAGATLDYDQRYRTLITQAISVIGAATGQKFTIIDTKM